MKFNNFIHHSIMSRKIAHQTHLLVYGCKQLYWSLCQNGFEVQLMWIPSHVGLVGNELADERARQAALNSAETGRFFHSIFPDVTPRPWFEGQKEERSFVCTVARVLSGHCSVRSHLGRFRIVEDLMCVCAGDYEKVDHLIWHCESFTALYSTRTIHSAQFSAHNTPQHYSPRTIHRGTIHRGTVHRSTIHHAQFTAKKYKFR
jgi:hypothetical protein